MSIKVKIFRSRIILVASHFSLHKLPAQTTHMHIWRWLRFQRPSLPTKFLYKAAQKGTEQL